MGDSPPVASLEQRHSHDVQDCDHQCPPCLCILGSPGCRIWNSCRPPHCLPPAPPTSDSSFSSNPIGIIDQFSSIKFCFSFSSLSWSCPICSCSFSYNRGCFSLCQCSSIFWPCSFTTRSCSSNTISISWSCPICSCSFSYSRGFFSLCKCSSIFWPCSFTTRSFSSNTISCSSTTWTCSFPTICCSSSTISCPPSLLRSSLLFPPANSMLRMSLDNLVLVMKTLTLRRL